MQDNSIEKFVVDVKQQYPAVTSQPSVLKNYDKLSDNMDNKADNVANDLRNNATEFLERLKRNFNGRQDVILLLGPQGVGKSSLINTAAAALRGHYEDRYEGRSAARGSQVNSNELNVLVYYCN